MSDNLIKVLGKDDTDHYLNSKHIIHIATGDGGTWIVHLSNGDTIEILEGELKKLTETHKKH